MEWIVIILHDGADNIGTVKSAAAATLISRSAEFASGIETPDITAKKPIKTSVTKRRINIGRHLDATRNRCKNPLRLYRHNVRPAPPCGNPRQSIVYSSPKGRLSDFPKWSATGSGRAFCFDRAF